MNFTPMHKVELIHSWKEIDKSWSEAGTRTTVDQCQDCGVKAGSVPFRPCFWAKPEG